MEIVCMRIDLWCLHAITHHTVPSNTTHTGKQKKKKTQKDFVTKLDEVSEQIEKGKRFFFYNIEMIFIIHMFDCSMCSYTTDEPKIGEIGASSHIWWFAWAVHCFIPFSIHIPQVSANTQTHYRVDRLFSTTTSIRSFCPKFRIRVSFVHFWRLPSHLAKNRVRCPKRGRLVGIDITRTRVLSMCLCLYVFLFCFFSIFSLFVFSFEHLSPNTIVRFILFSIW